MAGNGLRAMRKRLRSLDAAAVEDLGAARVERPEPMRQGTQAVACHLYDSAARETAA